MNSSKEWNCNEICGEAISAGELAEISRSMSTILSQELSLKKEFSIGQHYRHNTTSSVQDPSKYFQDTTKSFKISSTHISAPSDSSRNKAPPHERQCCSSITLSSSSPRDIRFVDLMGDTFLHIMSYLTSTGIRNVSATSQDIRSVITGPGGAQHLWKNICQRESWESSLAVMSSSPSTSQSGPVVFRDDLSIPVAGVPQDEDNEEKMINLSLLLGLTASSYPTAIDPAFFQNYMGSTIKYGAHRRSPEFRTFPMKLDLAVLKQRGSGCIHEDGVKTGSDSFIVGQFSDRVGVGARCIKSDQPFPRLLNNTPNKVKTTLHLCTNKTKQRRSSPSKSTNNLHCGTCYKPPTKLRLAKSLSCLSSQLSKTEISSRVGVDSHLDPAVAAKTASPIASHMRPFVIPRVKKFGDVNEVDITPSLVAYFEVTILPQDKSQEPPLLTCSPSPNSSSAQNAFESAIAAFGGVGSDSNSPKQDCVAIGLSTASFATQRKMPGWDEQSYGYHSDDGAYFHAGKKVKSRSGPRFGVYDTVGCGLDYSTKLIFFTRNGKFISFATNVGDAVLERGLYPTVGVDTNCPLLINFGQKPFEYNLAPFHDFDVDLLQDNLSGLLQPPKQVMKRQ